MAARAQLTTLLRSRISIAWLALIALTLVSWGVGTDGGVAPRTSAIVVLLVAFFKVRLVGLYFMELRDAPLPLRLILEGYCAVICLVLVIMYLAGGS